MEDKYVNNAGIIILCPFLPSLFDRLQLTEDGEFKNENTKNRAVSFLHYLVMGDSVIDEYKLALNKLLLGIPLDQTIFKFADIIDLEKDNMKSLLNAVIQHWKPLGHTSIDGLRETFLQREAIGA